MEFKRNIITEKEFSLKWISSLKEENAKGLSNWLGHNPIST